MERTFQTIIGNVQSIIRNYGDRVVEVVRRESAGFVVRDRETGRVFNVTFTEVGVEPVVVADPRTAETGLGGMARIRVEKGGHAALGGPYINPGAQCPFCGVYQQKPAFGDTDITRCPHYAGRVADAGGEFLLFFERVFTRTPPKSPPNPV